MWVHAKWGVERRREGNEKFDGRKVLVEFFIAERTTVMGRVTVLQVERRIRATPDTRFVLRVQPMTIVSTPAKEPPRI